jgi:hypothetical protein
MTKSDSKVAPKARTTQRASELFEPVRSVLKDHPEGLSLPELANETGIRARVLSNVVWHLVKAEKVRKIQDSPRKVRYVSAEVKVPRTRKSTTAEKAATKAA